MHSIFAHYSSLFILRSQIQLFYDRISTQPHLLSQILDSSFEEQPTAIDIASQCIVLSRNNRTYCVVFEDLQKKDEILEKLEQWILQKNVWGHLSLDHEGDTPSYQSYFGQCWLGLLGQSHHEQQDDYLVVSPKVQMRFQDPFFSFQDLPYLFDSKMAFYDLSQDKIVTIWELLEKHLLGFNPDIELDFWSLYYQDKSANRAQFAKVLKVLEYQTVHILRYWKNFQENLYALSDSQRIRFWIDLIQYVYIKKHHDCPFFTEALLISDELALYTALESLPYALETQKNILAFQQSPKIIQKILSILTNQGKNAQFLGPVVRKYAESAQKSLLLESLLPHLDRDHPLSSKLQGCFDALCDTYSLENFPLKDALYYDHYKIFVTLFQNGMKLFPQDQYLNFLLNLSHQIESQYPLLENSALIMKFKIFLMVGLYYPNSEVVETLFLDFKKAYQDLDPLYDFSPQVFCPLLDFFYPPHYPDLPKNLTRFGEFVFILTKNFFHKPYVRQFLIELLDRSYTQAIQKKCTKSVVWKEYIKLAEKLKSEPNHSLREDIFYNIMRQTDRDFENIQYLVCSAFVQYAWLDDYFFKDSLLSSPFLHDSLVIQNISRLDSYLKNKDWTAAFLKEQCAALFEKLNKIEPVYLKIGRHSILSFEELSVLRKLPQIFFKQEVYQNLRANRDEKIGQSKIFVSLPILIARLQDPYYDEATKQFFSKKMSDLSQEQNHKRDFLKNLIRARFNLVNHQFATFVETASPINFEALERFFMTVPAELAHVQKIESIEQQQERFQYLWRTFLHQASGIMKISPKTKLQFFLDLTVSLYKKFPQSFMVKELSTSIATRVQHLETLSEIRVLLSPKTTPDSLSLADYINTLYIISADDKISLKKWHQILAHEWLGIMHQNNPRVVMIFNELAQHQDHVLRDFLEALFSTQSELFTETELTPKTICALLEAADKDNILDQKGLEFLRSYVLEIGSPNNHAHPSPRTIIFSPQDLRSSPPSPFSPSGNSFQPYKPKSTNKKNFQSNPLKINSRAQGKW